MVRPPAQFVRPAEKEARRMGALANLIAGCAAGHGDRINK
jgi:hypothetical protein